MGRDLDVEGMTRVQLKDEVMKLRGAVRKIVNARGHDLCWWWPEAAVLLPENAGKPDPQPPPTCEFLMQCALFRATLDPPPTTGTSDEPVSDLQLPRDVQELPGPT